MIDLLTDLVLAALILLAIYGVGRTLRPLVGLKAWCRAADLAFALALGLGTLVTALFVLALLGLLLPAMGWGLVVLGVALAAAHIRNLRQDVTAIWLLVGQLRGASWFVRLAALLATCFLIMNLAADLAPPIEGDTVNQYLLVPREWVAAGRYIQPAYIWASTLPGNMMMLSAWALLIRPSFSLATLVTGFGMSLFLCLSIYALSRLYFGRAAAALAMVAAYTMPDAGYLAQSAKVDMGWAFFEVLALAAFLHWLDRRDSGAARADGWLIVAGVCLGWAAGSKNQTLISIALLGIWLVARLIRRRDWRGLARNSAAFGIAILAAALPYYLTNAVLHHNPFYPVFADWLAPLLNGTTSPRSELGTEIFYSWSVGGYLTNLWNMSLGHGRRFYLGFIAGPIFLLTIPIGLIMGYLRGQRAAWRMLGYAFAFSVIWFLVKQAARHFLPGLALLSVVTGLLLHRLDKAPWWTGKVLRSAALLVLAGNLIVWLGVMYWSGAYRVALGIEDRQEYLQRWHDEVAGANFPDWDLITVLNTQLTPNARVLTANTNNLLYLSPQMVSDIWGDRLSYRAIVDEQALLAALHERDISYILIFKTRRQDEALYMQPAFLQAHTTLIYDGERARLYQIDGWRGED